AERRKVGPGEEVLHHPATGDGSPDLAEHADAPEPDAVDEQVVGRQVELGADEPVWLAGVVDPSAYPAQPLAREGELLAHERREERGEIAEQPVRVDRDRLPDEALL